MAWFQMECRTNNNSQLIDAINPKFSLIDTENGGLNNTKLTFKIKVNTLKAILGAVNYNLDNNNLIVTPINQEDTFKVITCHLTDDRAFYFLTCQNI